MFHSVIEQQGGWRSGRFGVGAGVSVLAHVALFGAVVLLSRPGAKEDTEPYREIGTMRLVAPPRGNPHPVVASQVAPRPKPRTQRIPRTVPPPIVPQDPVKNDPPDAPPDVSPAVANLPYIPGSDPNGVETGGIPGVPLPSALTDAIDKGGDEQILVFNGEMQRPELLSDVPIQLPNNALLAGVEGSVIIKCVITTRGEVDGCRIIKGLPMVNDAVVSSLEARRYRPVMYQGHAVNVSYNFTVHIRSKR